MPLLSIHAMPVVNTLTHSLKSTARSRAVQIFHCCCIAICLLYSNCRSLFGFLQITGVGNSNRCSNYSHFRIKHCIPSPYRLFPLVVTAECACLKLMMWKLLLLQILCMFHPLHVPSLRWCAKTKTEKTNPVLEIENRTELNRIWKIRTDPALVVM